MNFRFFFKKITTATLDILFPPICLACETTLAPDEKRRSCCAHCFDSILVAAGFSCPTCGARLPTISDRCHDSPYALAAATQFSNHATQRLIYALKYNRIRAAAIPLADLLTTHLQMLQLDLSNSIFIPIPLHHARECERGFNQSELVARQLGATLAIPVVAHALQRIRATEPQATNKKCSRETNVSGCFAVLDPAAIRGPRVLLVDDVTTSGSTLREATRALHAAGARQVIALVVARAR